MMNCSMDNCTNNWTLFDRKSLLDTLCLNFSKLNFLLMFFHIFVKRSKDWNKEIYYLFRSPLNKFWIQHTQICSNNYIIAIKSTSYIIYNSFIIQHIKWQLKIWIEIINLCTKSYLSYIRKSQNKYVEELSKFVSFTLIISFINCHGSKYW